jgi:hypothetical protein
VLHCARALPKAVYISSTVFTTTSEASAFRSVRQLSSEFISLSESEPTAMSARIYMARTSVQVEAVVETEDQETRR